MRLYLLHMAFESREIDIFVQISSTILVYRIIQCNKCNNMSLRNNNIVIPQVGDKLPNSLLQNSTSFKDIFELYHDSSNHCHL